MKKGQASLQCTRRCSGAGSSPQGALGSAPTTQLRRKLDSLAGVSSSFPCRPPSPDEVNCTSYALPPAQDQLSSSLPSGAPNRSPRRVGRLQTRSNARVHLCRKTGQEALHAPGRSAPPDKHPVHPTLDPTASDMLLRSEEHTSELQSQ